MARTRDFGAEYRHRIARGLERGLTRQAARGHASAKPTKHGGSAAFDPALEAALRRLRKPGASISKVAKDAHVSRERLSRYVKAVAGAHRDGKIWRFDDRRMRKMKIIEADALDAVSVRTVGFQEAHIAGLHYHEASQALRHPKKKADFLRRWEGVRIRDIEGRWHTLSTDFNQILRALLTQDYSFERFYAIEH